MRSYWREFLLAAVTVAALVTVRLLPPIPQDLAYHSFADTHARSPELRTSGMSFQTSATW
jgi:hypothetical protein